MWKLLGSCLEWKLCISMAQLQGDSTLEGTMARYVCLSDTDTLEEFQHKNICKLHNDWQSCIYVMIFVSDISLPCGKWCLPDWISQRGEGATATANAELLPRKAKGIWSFVTPSTLYIKLVLILYVQWTFILFCLLGDRKEATQLYSCSCGSCLSTDETGWRQSSICISSWYLQAGKVICFI